jgi:endonuclease-3
MPELNKKTRAIKWEQIITALENWRASFPSEKGMPSVSTVAERYKKDPWAVLISTLISLRTKDEVTMSASQQFLAQIGTPGDCTKFSRTAIEKMIYPAGFYRTKADNIKKIAEILLEKYSGKVPADLDTLLSLPGVGRKTANLVIIEAFDLDGICVDTHVHRISCRTGWVNTKSADETEQELRKILPLEFWKRINALLVLYGQHICRPISPFCSKCVIKTHCKRINVEKTR